MVEVYTIRVFHSPPVCSNGKSCRVYLRGGYEAWKNQVYVDDDDNDVDHDGDCTTTRTLHCKYINECIHVTSCIHISFLVYSSLVVSLVRDKRREKSLKGEC